MSNLINGGLYIFNVEIFSRIPEGERAAMNDMLPAMAMDGSLYHLESKGYWVKMTDVRTFLSAAGPQLEMARIMSPNVLAPHSGPAVPKSAQIVGNVLIEASASIGEDCKLGPDVVIGCAPRRAALGSAACVPSACARARV